MLRLEEHIERPGEERWDRNPLRYYFSVFGQPGGSDPWAWRVGGHHIGFHFTVVDGDLISPLPLFFGANPSQVKYGPETGLRTLPEEEDLARELVQSLDADQRAVAIVDPVAPDDLLTKNYRSVTPDMTPVGLGAEPAGRRPARPAGAADPPLRRAARPTTCPRRSGRASSRPASTG